MQGSVASAPRRIPQRLASDEPLRTGTPNQAIHDQRTRNSALLIQNRRKTKESSYSKTVGKQRKVHMLEHMKVLCIPEIYTGGMSWHFLSSLPPSVCLSSFLESGVKTVQCIRTTFSGWIDPTSGRVILYFSGVHDARGTRHVPPREDLHKPLANPAGQTGGPNRPH